MPASGQGSLHDHDALYIRVHPPFPIHVLPKGVHRIRHYGLFANGVRAVNLQTMRALLDGTPSDPGTNKSDNVQPQDPDILRQACPCCGGTMRIIKTFEPGRKPRVTAQRAGNDSS